MDEYEICERERGPGPRNRGQNHRGKMPKNWRSSSRQWEYLVCTVCAGCGKPLGRYENLNRLAYCKSCREILFPETVIRRQPRWKRGRY